MNEFTSLAIEEPIDLVKLCINKYVRVKLRHDLELKGKLHAFDTHFNLLLSDVEEEQMVKVEDPNTHIVLNKKQKRKIKSMLFVRGDQVVIVSPAK